jgi:serine/threonine protein kinase
LRKEAEGYYSELCSTVCKRPVKEMGTSKVHWTEVAGVDPYLEHELREMNKETFGNLKAKWSHFFLDNTENLVVSERIAVGAQTSIFEAHWPGWEGVLPHSNGLVLKVFDTGYPLKDLQMKLSEEFLSYANHANETGKLWNPRICHIFGGLLLDNGVFAFAMERCWGDLRRVIEIRMRHNDNQGPPFSTMVSKRIMLEIAEGMQGLHELGIIHRDVRASNIFIKPIDVLGDPEAVDIPMRSLDDVHGDTKASKIPIISSGKVWNPSKDDAFSCVVGDYECNGHVIGAMFWRAPEILLAMKNRDVQPALFTQTVDVYSYSMTCYEILTGEIPFQDVLPTNVLNGNRPQLPKTIDLAMKTLLSRCWHHDPSQRPTFIEICKELRIMISQPEPIALEPQTDNEENSNPNASDPQVDNEGNLGPIALLQSNCFPEELNGLKSFHSLIIELLMFVVS